MPLLKGFSSPSSRPAAHGRSVTWRKQSGAVPVFAIAVDATGGGWSPNRPLGARFSPVDGEPVRSFSTTRTFAAVCGSECPMQPVGRCGRPLEACAARNSSRSCNGGRHRSGRYRFTAVALRPHRTRHLGRNGVRCRRPKGCPVTVAAMARGPGSTDVTGRGVRRLSRYRGVGRAPVVGRLRCAAGGGGRRPALAIRRWPLPTGAGSRCTRRSRAHRHRRPDGRGRAPAWWKHRSMALSAEAPHLVEDEPFRLRQAAAERVEAGTGPGDIQTGDVPVAREKNQPHAVLLIRRAHRIDWREPHVRLR